MRTEVVSRKVGQFAFAEDDGDGNLGGQVAIG